MDNIRETLIELLSVNTCPNAICNFCEHFKNGYACERHKKEAIADHLIANGVTIATDNNVGDKLTPTADKVSPVAYKSSATAEWIPVTERFPENDYNKHWKERQYYLVRLKPSGLMCVAHYGYKEHDWWIDSHDCVLSKDRYKEVTHWMPLPEPPKED